MLRLLTITFIILFYTSPLANGTGSGSNEFSGGVFTTEVGAFKIGGQVFRIWESTRNKVHSPTRWQFRYDPLFAPEVRKDRSLVLQNFKVGNHWRTSLKVLLDSEVAAKKAFKVIRQVYPEAKNISEHNVFAKTILSIALSIPEISHHHEGCKILNPTMNFNSVPQSFIIDIISPDQETALSLSKNLPHYRIQYEVFSNHVVAKKNNINVSMRQIKNSNLIAELDGMGTNPVYIHRNDMRKLLEDIQTNIVADVYIESPESFREGLLQQLINRYFERTTASLKTFDEKKWASTYHGDDLRPNIIQERMNKKFKKDEDTQEWKTKASVGISGETSVKIGSAKSKFDASYSNEELKKKLRQLDIQASFKGSIIEVKSVQVYKVNLSKLKEDQQAIIQKTLVRPVGIKGTLGYINLKADWYKYLVECKDCKGKKLSKCTTCQGKGNILCKNCRGTKKVLVGGYKTIHTTKTCFSCNGVGSKECSEYKKHSFWGGWGSCSSSWKCYECGAKASKRKSEHRYGGMGTGMALGGKSWYKKTQLIDYYYRKTHKKNYDCRLCIGGSIPETENIRETYHKDCTKCKNGYIACPETSCQKGNIPCSLCCDKTNR